MALAAMSLNFLLGYTGVLSFGHAAYFGLGGYGAGMAIKYLSAEHARSAWLVGVLAGPSPPRSSALLIVRLRGVYFAMVTIAFGQVFYFIAFRWKLVTGGDDGLSRVATLPIDLRLHRSISWTSNKAFLLLCACYSSLVAVAMMAAALAFAVRAHAAWRSAKTSAARGFSAFRSSATSGFRGSISCIFVSLAGALYALLNNFIDPHDAALDPVRRFRDHGGARRDARVLGPAARRRNLRRAAGLPVEPDAELDVVHRAVLRAYRAVLSRAAFSVPSGRRRHHESVRGRKRFEDISAA